MVLTITLKYTGLVFVTLLFSLSSYSQTITFNNSGSKNQDSTKKENVITNPTTNEICGNNIDDDNNGLTDQKDFYCYFNPYKTYPCQPSKIVWACTGTGLHWADLETGDERTVGLMNSKIMTDITWASNGKLYGIEGVSGIIWEINPNTSQTTFLCHIPGYDMSNAMTADASGNLYLAAYKTIPDHWDIIKINLISLQATFIADLTALGLDSGGDLTFLNGDLYLACNLSNMAKINVATGNVQAISIINSPDPSPYGLITLGDGFLYMSSGRKVYKIDPVIMKVDQNPFFAFQNPIGTINGMSNYSETCNGSACKAKVTITISSTQLPYCSEYGVLLMAIGSGITGQGSYMWTLPNGSTAVGTTFLATQSGKHYVYYHTIPDTCGWVDSVSLTFVSGCEKKLFIPSAFTPNGDGTNDIFKPTFFGMLDVFKIQVYNRYGQVVFHSVNALNGWDGAFMKKPQPYGSYTWIIQYKFTGNSAIQTETGNIILIR